MSLRRQLLLVSLLLFALPWAGCQYVREMEGALQSGQEQALLATTRAVARVLGDRPRLLYPNLARWQDDSPIADQVYAATADAPVIVDGYADGWEGAPNARYGDVALRAQTRGPLLYLLFTVEDHNVVYHDPRNDRRASGDRLVLRGARGIDYVIATAAPGAVQGRVERKHGPMQYDNRIRGFWQDSLTGFTVELEIPLALLDDRFGFYRVQDSGVASTGVASSVGNISPRSRGRPPWLVYSPLSLQSWLSPFAESDVQLQVVDVHGWEVGRVDSEPQNSSTSDAPWLLQALYRAILNDAAPATPPAGERIGQVAAAELPAALAGASTAAWYDTPDRSGLKTLSAAAPVMSDGRIAGAIVASQSSERYLSLTDQAFTRLLYYSLLALLLSALGLLGYASWLSWRIRRLSLASAGAIRPDGSLDDSFPVSNRRDEIGELSRQYADLLGRLRDYTDYLRTLSRKLSHELRTPIAVIQSSLDNLEAGQVEDSDVYVQRAREGLSRLGNILTAMSEATRLEESVHNNRPEDYDLAALCSDLLEAYRTVYDEQNLHIECEVDSLEAHGVPDLVAQMLDKLMDNAASFTPAGGDITLSLERLGTSTARIGLRNEGPLLPQEMQQQLFDSMVSVRDRTDRVHLGLGLHIVRLIVDFHGGSVRAENLPDESGVIFLVELPLSGRAPAD